MGLICFAAEPALRRRERIGTHLNRKAASEWAAKLPLFTEALLYLEAAGATPTLSASYEETWPMQDQGERFLPCPQCFIAGIERPLWLMPEHQGIQTASCRHCGLMLHGVR